MKTKKITLIGLLVAVAFVLSYVESLLPISLGIPGIKLGLSNIVVVLCIYELTAPQTFGVAMARILLMGLTFGSFSTLLYSFAGGILSFFCMLPLKRIDKFSVYGVSLVGGVAHNIGQILMAVLLLNTSLLLYYLPFLLVAGSISGMVIGFAAARLQKRLHVVFVNARGESDIPKSDKIE